MKKQFIGGLLALIGLVLLATGCGVLTKRQVTSVPGPPRLEAVVQTNTPSPQVTVGTDAAGLPVLVTNVPVPVLVTNYVRVPTEVLVTNYVPNPKVVETAAVVQAANSALNPTPTAPLVNLGAGLVTALAAGAAAWQNRRAAKERSGRSTAEDLLRTVVTAVETYADPGVKREVATVSALRGNSAALDAVVQAISAQVPTTSLTAMELLEFARSGKPLSDLPAKYHEAVVALREQLARS